MNERVKAGILKSTEAIERAEKHFNLFYILVKECTDALHAAKYAVSVQQGFAALNQAKKAQQAIDLALLGLPAVNLLAACEGVSEDTVETFIKVYKTGKERQDSIMDDTNSVKLVLYSVILKLRTQRITNGIDTFDDVKFKIDNTIKKVKHFATKVEELGPE